jgi:hypothetical protein
MAELFRSVFEYVTRGEYPLWFRDRSELVEYGIARFINEGKDVTVQEPMALVGIARHFSAHGYSDTLEREVRPTPQRKKGRAFEQALVIALTRMFQDNVKMEEVFQFHGSNREPRCKPSCRCFRPRYGITSVTTHGNSIPRPRTGGGGALAWGGRRWLVHPGRLHGPQPHGVVEAEQREISTSRYSGEVLVRKENSSRC